VALRTGQFVTSYLPLFDPKQKRSRLDFHVLSGFGGCEPFGGFEFRRWCCGCHVGSLAPKSCRTGATTQHRAQFELTLDRVHLSGTLTSMHAIRWCVGCVVGILAGYLSLSIIVTLAYALPRAIMYATRGFVGWSVSRFYLIGASAYAGLLLVVLLIAHWIADPEALLVGAVLPITPMLVNVKKLKADVDERLRKALVISSRNTPNWVTNREKPPLRLTVVKMFFHLTGSYPCSRCKRSFKSADWLKWIGEEPTVDLLWSGALCLNCFSEMHEELTGRPF
jgi:hypothetical protein